MVNRHLLSQFPFTQKSIDRFFKCIVHSFSLSFHSFDVDLYAHIVEQIFVSCLFHAPKLVTRLLLRHKISKNLHQATNVLCVLTRKIFEYRHVQ